MFSTTTIDPAQLRPLLVSLRMPDRRPEPELIWVTDNAAHARIRPVAVDWAEGIPNCLMALSYQMRTLEPGTDAIGVWLPQHHAVQVVDATMRCHVISLSDSPAFVPVEDRTIIARELRALIGTVLMRPSRLSTDAPVVIADNPALTDRLVRACAVQGQHIRQVEPEHASQVWQHAVKVYVHQSVAAELAAAGLSPRADVTILASAFTDKIRQAAAALHTDEVHRWPAATRHIASSLKRHALAQAIVRDEMR